MCEVIDYLTRGRDRRRVRRETVTSMTVPIVAGSGTTGTPRMLEFPGVEPSGDEPAKMPGVTMVGGIEFRPVPKFVTANSHSSPGSKMPSALMLSDSRFALDPVASM